MLNTFILKCHPRVCAPRVRGQLINTARVFWTEGGCVSLWGMQMNLDVLYLIVKCN